MPGDIVTLKDSDGSKISAGVYIGNGNMVASDGTGTQKVDTDSDSFYGYYRLSFLSDAMN
jgi:cell wall-associated NlpC family hydrolase